MISFCLLLSCNASSKTSFTLFLIYTNKSGSLFFFAIVRTPFLNVSRSFCVLLRVPSGNIQIEHPRFSPFWISERNFFVLLLSLSNRIDPPFWTALPKNKESTKIARFITELENKTSGSEAIRHLLETHKPTKEIPVVGITGTGGAGKSSLVDELVRRFLMDRSIFARPE